MVSQPRQPGLRRKWKVGERLIQEKIQGTTPLSSYLALDLGCRNELETWTLLPMIIIEDSGEEGGDGVCGKVRPVGEIPG